MNMGCDCNDTTGLGYRTVTNGDVTVIKEDMPPAELDEFTVVASVCDLAQGHIGTFNRLAEILRSNMRGEHPWKLNTLEVNKAANFIRQADLFGACNFMLQKEGYDFDATAFVDEIVENGAPGEMSLAGLGGWLPWAGVGLALYAMASGGNKARSKARGSW